VEREPTCGNLEAAKEQTYGNSEVGKEPIYGNLGEENELICGNLEAESAVIMGKECGNYEVGSEVVALDDYLDRVQLDQNNQTKGHNQVLQTQILLIHV
jgi:hypothetical protein